MMDLNGYKNLLEDQLEEYELIGRVANCSIAVVHGNTVNDEVYGCLNALHELRKAAARISNSSALIEWDWDVIIASRLSKLTLASAEEYMLQLARFFKELGGLAWYHTQHPDLGLTKNLSVDLDTQVITQLSSEAFEASWEGHW